MNCSNGKKSLKIKTLEQALIENVYQLFRKLALASRFPHRAQQETRRDRQEHGRARLTARRLGDRIAQRADDFSGMSAASEPRSAASNRAPLARLATSETFPLTCSARGPI